MGERNGGMAEALEGLCKFSRFPRSVTLADVATFYASSWADKSAQNRHSIHPQGRRQHNPLYSLMGSEKVESMSEDSQRAAIEGAEAMLHACMPVLCVYAALRADIESP